METSMFLQVNDRLLKNESLIRYFMDILVSLNSCLIFEVKQILKAL